MELRFENTDIRVRVTQNKAMLDMSVINDDGETLDTETIGRDLFFAMLHEWSQEFAGG